MDRAAEAAGSNGENGAGRVERGCDDALLAHTKQRDCSENTKATAPDQGMRSLRVKCDTSLRRTLDRTPIMCSGVSRDLVHPVNLRMPALPDSLDLLASDDLPDRAWADAQECADLRDGDRTSARIIDQHDAP